MCEIKSSKTKGTAITMAGLKPKYHIPQREQIERYGIRKEGGPKRFSSTFKVGHVNPRGLETSIKDDFVIISDANSKEDIMSWPIQDIINKLASKCGNVVYTKADRRTAEDGKEEYNYRASDFYSGFSPKSARKLLEEGKIIIETRSKIKDNGSIRDHGTVFRVGRKNLPDLYAEVDAFISSALKKK